MFGSISKTRDRFSTATLNVYYPFHKLNSERQLSKLKLYEVLDKYAIANSFEVYSGTHTSKVADAFQNHVLPFFGQTLCFSGELPMTSIMNKCLSVRCTPQTSVVEQSRGLLPLAVCVLSRFFVRDFLWITVTHSLLSAASLLLLAVLCLPQSREQGPPVPAPTQGPSIKVESRIVVVDVVVTDKQGQSAVAADAG
jgi:hypothetical protein